MHPVPADVRSCGAGETALRQGCTAEKERKKRLPPTRGSEEGRRPAAQGGSAAWRAMRVWVWIWPLAEPAEAGWAGAPRGGAGRSRGGRRRRRRGKRAAVPAAAAAGLASGVTDQCGVIF